LLNGVSDRWRLLVRFARANLAGRNPLLVIQLWTSDGCGQAFSTCLKGKMT
jgi:hypothetical protein